MMARVGVDRGYHEEIKDFTDVSGGWIRSWYIRLMRRGEDYVAWCELSGTESFEKETQWILHSFLTIN